MIQTIESPPRELSPSEAQLLMREFSHRISNELASAIGIISMAAARSMNEEVKAALVVAQDHLQNYAQVHLALRMPEHSICIDAATYLRQLCRAISRSKLHSKGIELILVERTFLMNSERCWRLGLIVSELITNAARHAFCDDGGLIRVELLPSATFVECRVTDNGARETNIRPGWGLKIVDALAKSLGGSIDHHFGSKGATSVLIFPLNSEVNHDAPVSSTGGTLSENSRSATAETIGGKRTKGSGRVVDANLSR
jgi:two-component sensor histidine kinase